MRRFGITAFVLSLFALAMARPPVLSADAPVAGVQLRAISSTVDGQRTAVLVEASEPVAYVALRPDPRTLLLELRDVTSAGFANGFRARPGSPVTAVDVEDGIAADGAPLARVRVAFSRTLTPKVRSQRNLIFIEADGAVQAQDARADADPVPADTIAPRAPRPPDADAATSLRSVESHVESGGVAIILEGNGRLTPRNVHETGSPNDRVVLDFHGMTPSVRSVTSVGQGSVERVRVAVNSRDPLVTRVVVDLARRTPYRIEPLRTDGRRIRVVFADAAPEGPPSGQPERVTSPPPAVDALAALSEPGPAERPAAARSSAAQAQAPQASPASTPPSPAPAPAAPAAAAVLPTAPRPSAQTDVTGNEAISRSGAKVFSGHPVSLDFQGADLRAVLRTFAEISGLNIVIDPAVQGSVDVALRDVPWDQAMDIILRANKLGYFVDGTIVRVAPLTVLSEEEKQRRKLTEEQALSGELRVITHTLSYARAEEVAPLLTKSALSPRGTVQVDPRTNTLIISDLQASLDTASSLIATLDQPQPQVEIEARIVQTTRDFARTIGVQWGLNGRATPELGNTTGLAFPNSGSLTGRAGPVQGPAGNPTPSAVNLGVGAASSALGLALGAINGSFNLDVALSALERQGHGKLLSTPRVSTQNNVEAEITQGVQIPIQTIANNTVTVTFKDAALTLKVTPQITSANTVIMKITVENASPDFSRAIGENAIPPIDTQRAITQVLVNDGQTTVIGGIYVSREQAVTDRTPGLHRLPLLGWLFKRHGVQDESRELLIFITPRILR